MSDASKELHRPFTASGFGLRHMEAYGGLPAHILSHLQPQFLHPGLSIGSGAFRPLGDLKGFPQPSASAFAPPKCLKIETSSSETTSHVIACSSWAENWTLPSLCYRAIIRDYFSLRRTTGFWDQAQGRTHARHNRPQCRLNLPVVWATWKRRVWMPRCHQKTEMVVILRLLKLTLQGFMRITEDFAVSTFNTILFKSAVTVSHRIVRGTQQDYSFRVRNSSKYCAVT